MDQNDRCPLLDQHTAPQRSIVLRLPVSTLAKPIGNGSDGLSKKCEIGGVWGVGGLISTLK